ncbi:MAG: sulfite exporter TauE/SafE family protein [Actinomycetota bacterium]|nr:sulfite exporter TauE/SafE family protein [Actinomycetota bacterium]
MSPAAAAVAALLGAALQSATGFGFSVVAAPLLVAVFGPGTAVSTMVVLAFVVTSLTVAGEGRRPRVPVAEVAALIAWTVPGLLAGALALRVVPERALALLVAVVVLVAVALRLGARAPAPARAGRPSAGRTAVVGLASGTLGASTGLSGPPVVFHLLGRGLDPARMRDTLAVVFMAGYVLTAAALVATGAFALPAELPLLLACTVAGQVAGRPVFAALHGERYERAVLAVLALTGVLALVASAT